MQARTGAFLVRHKLLPGCKLLFQNLELGKLLLQGNEGCIHNIIVINSQQDPSLQLPFLDAPVEASKSGELTSPGRTKEGTDEHLGGGGRKPGCYQEPCPKDSGFRSPTLVLYSPEYCPISARIPCVIMAGGTSKPGLTWIERPTLLYADQKGGHTRNKISYFWKIQHDLKTS